MARPHLVLFDIDHTLVDVLRFHEPAYALALKEIYGIEARLRDIEFSGKTTPNILREIAEHHHVSQREIEAGLVAALLRFNSAVLEGLEPDLRPYLLPGIPDLLRCLSSHGHVLGVLTGNPPEVGVQVLLSSGLAATFAIRTFGTEARERPALVGISAIKARDLLGFSFQPDDVVIVGDSPHDVRAGKSYGARTVALETGLSTHLELAAAAPDYIFRDAQEYRQVCEAITGDQHDDGARP
ncbi:MAG: HAD family hydrolase [Chloroflexota bacterium]